MLADRNDPVGAVERFQSARTAARRLNLELTLLSCGTEDEIETAFATAVQQRVGALYVGAGAFIVSRREQIAALASRAPCATHDVREAVAAGQLISYGASQVDVYRQTGVYVGRILKGEKTGDLPVIQPTKFELIVNLKTARALGLEIPPTLLARADEVIE